jgi:hypothetical protein
VANADAASRPRLTEAAKAALEEQLDELRENVIREAARSGEGDTVAAADVVRAYYRLVPSVAKTRQASRPTTIDSLLYSNSTLQLFRVVTYASVGLMVVCTGLYFGLPPGLLLPNIMSLVGTIAILSAVNAAIYGALWAFRVSTRNRAVAIQRWSEATNDFVVTSSIRNDTKKPVSLAEPVSDGDIARSTFLNNWIEVESQLDRLYLLTVAVEIKDVPRPFGAKVNELRLAGVLSPRLNSKLVSLLKVRNDVVHNRDLPLNLGEVIRDLGFVNGALKTLTERSAAN